MYGRGVLGGDYLFVMSSRSFDSDRSNQMWLAHLESIAWNSPRNPRCCCPIYERSVQNVMSTSDNLIWAVLTKA